MKVNYLSRNIEDEDKIPENITIRTMHSDMARLKEISKRKPTETSKDLPNKMSEVNLKEELNDFYPKKPGSSSFLNSHKKAAPPAQLPTEKSEFSLQDQSLKKKKENIAISNTAGRTAIGLEKKTKTKTNGKKIILIVVLTIILICAGLVFYNFFILQNENTGKNIFSNIFPNIFPIEETEKPKEEKPKSIIPEIPFIPDFQKPVIPTVQFFIPIEEIFSFDIFSDEEFDLITVLDSYLETLEKIPEIALIEIRDENKILNLEKLSQKINIKIPKKIMEDISKDSYALIFFNFENEYRLGLIVEIDNNNIEKIKKNASQWETTLIDDLELLFLKTEIGFPATANFQENTYKEIKIRYMNFSEPDVTIDYAFDNNKLILATSKKSIYKIIDILKK
jgi:hypothetical protein